MGLIHKNQWGFTLIELIIAIAITGLITGGITMAIFQVFSGNARTNNHMIAVRQVQEAGYWVSRDAQMAQILTPTPSPDPDGFPLTLSWTEWDGTVNVVTYTLEDMIGGSKQLKRSYSVTGKPTETGIIAQYLDSDPAMTNCRFASGKLTLKVTARVGTQSETRVYEVKPRPGL